MAMNGNTIDISKVTPQEIAKMRKNMKICAKVGLVLTLLSCTWAEAMYYLLHERMQKWNTLFLVYLGLAIVWEITAIVAYRNRNTGKGVGFSLIIGFSFAMIALFLFSDSLANGVIFAAIPFPFIMGCQMGVMIFGTVLRRQDANAHR